MRRTALFLLASIALTVLLASAGPAGATFPGQNGRIAFAGYYGSIYTLNPDGSVLKELDVLGGDFVGARDPAFSPDGSKLAFVGERDTTDSSSRYDVYVADIDGSGVTNVTNLTNSAQHDQGYLYVDDRIGGFYISESDTHLAWSPDGQKIAFSMRNPDSYEGNGLFVMNAADGSGLVFVHQAHQFGRINRIAWSPDGSKLAFGEYSVHEPPIHEIYVVNADGGGLVNLTAGRGYEARPSWSPDGQKIVFVRCSDDYFCDVVGSEIYVMNADGTNPTALTNTPAAVEEWPVWSPDGSKIAFYRSVLSEDPETAEDLGGIFAMDSEGGGEQALTAPCAPSSFRVSGPLDWGTLAPESLPEGAATPSITKVRPKPGSTIQDSTPTIRAVVRTTAGELNPDEEIALCLDGVQKYRDSYDSGTGKLTYTVKDYEQLSLGVHSARVTAYDLQEGTRATKGWTFRVARR